MKTFSLVLLSCLVAAVFAQDNTRPDDFRGNKYPEDTCVFWGDPHIWTFDSAQYSYQDPGWHHIFISSTVNVQANFVPGCYSPIPTNSCAKDMRIFVLDDNNNVNVLELYLSDEAKAGFYKVTQHSPYYQILINGKDSGLHSVWDGQRVTKPSVQPGVGVQIGTADAGFAYYFLAQRDTIFQLQFKLNADVVISHLPDVLTITPINTNVRRNSLYNQICGLCGTFNGYAGDDFLLHGTNNRTIELKDSNIDRFANTWSVDYQASGAAAPIKSPVSKTGVFNCNFGPAPTPPPTQPPTSTPAPPTREPPTPAPTPAPTPSPPTPTDTPTPSPSPTPSTTPRPTPAPTPSQTPAPTYPPTQPPTTPPTNPPTEPPTNPPTDTPTPSPTPTQPSNTTSYNYTNVDNTTAVDNAKGTPIYDDALVSCANAGLEQGDPLWASCMYDVTQTNTTSLAVASAGALVLAGCAHSSLNDTQCVADTLFACPGACNANGACVKGSCVCNKGYQGETCTKAPLLTAAQLAGVISAGAVAGIAIGGAVFAGLAGFGAKKGYDYYHMKDNKMANVNSNPLYNEKNTGGVSPLYADKA